MCIALFFPNDFRKPYLASELIWRIRKIKIPDLTTGNIRYSAHTCKCHACKYQNCFDTQRHTHFVNVPAAICVFIRDKQLLWQMANKHFLYLSG